MKHQQPKARHAAARRLGLVMASAFLAVGGCSTALAADTAPTFSKDVAPILYAHCVTCHRPGQIAPMSLITYEQVRPWARSIREKVAAGAMPPWHADASHGQFLNDRRLSDHDKNAILRWVEAGAPQGNPSALPPAPVFSEGWQIGQPDVVLSMQETYNLPATGAIAYQNFTVPTNFTEDKWVQAIEIRPGNRKVVHHVLLYSTESPDDAQAGFTPVIPAAVGRGRGGPAPDILIASTAPGTNGMVFPAGSAVKIPAGAVLRFQMHYTATGKPETDRSSVGIIFAKEPPEVKLMNRAFLNPQLKLLPGAEDTAVDAAIEFNQDAHVFALLPHTHLRGKSWEYRLVYPDGHKEIVLSVPAYDFNWQTYYVFAKPLAVPKGARLESTAHYDNSANNKSNPDSTIEVHWGEQTWDEMQYTGITYSLDKH